MTPKKISALAGDYFSSYYLLYFFSFLSIYLFPPATPVLNILILLTSYYLIVFRRRLDTVLALILYSKSMSGFIVMHNPLAYDIVNGLCNVVPLMLYVFVVLLHRKRTNDPLNYLELILRHKFTLAFLVLLSTHFAFNFSNATDLVTKRYVPFVFFLLAVSVMRAQDFSVAGMIRFCRAVFTASVLLYFFYNYLGYTKLLLESDSVFKVARPPNSYSLVYFRFVRNYGFIWDHRVLGIVCYLFLALVLVFKTRHRGADILLSAVVVMTTTSRGAMITYAIILLAYLLREYRRAFLVTGAIILVVAGTFFVFMDRLLPHNAVGFIKSFSPASKYNAISQRQVFAEYAMDEFSERPVFGHGVGYLSSANVNRYIVVNKVRVPYVSDAFWYVLLAETGMVGMLLYLLFLLEVFHSSSVINLALFTGFCVQLIGTDIPDMRFYYFAILLIVYLVNNRLREQAITKNLRAREDPVVC